MSFEGIDPSAELYNIILEEQFEDFSKCYIAEISFEEFTCKVDVAYRIKHGVFPLMDEKMSYHLLAVVVEVGRKLMQDVENYFEEPEFDSNVYQQNVALYPKIMHGCYEQFMINYDGELSFKEYCCKIDIQYRIEHNCFPHDDDYSMAARLMTCAIDYGKKLIAKMDSSIDEVMHEEMIEAAADILWDCINDFLNSPIHQYISDEHGYHTSRRFPKKLIYDEDVSAALDHFCPDEADSIADEAFKWLKKKKFVRVVESGAKSKYDICELIDV
tara:strand:+ start:73 stop:888 length:816 start_codon:yes stop_codon:yes gene_type:complete